MSAPSVRLGDVTTRIGSGITPRGGSSVYKSAGRPFVRSQNVGWGDLRLDDMAYIDEATHATFPATEIRCGDVLLNITGASIGRSAVATPKLDGGNVNQHVCEIRLKAGRMDPRFVNAFLLSRSGQSQIDTFQAGGNRQGLNFQQVGSLQVPDLPIEQQRAIGAASQDADDLIATLERLIAKKQAIKQGMMQQLLTGRTRLPGFTDPWTEGTFDQLASLSSERAMPQSVAATTPLVGLDQIESGSGRLIGASQASDAVSLKATFKPGDVLFGKLRAYLRKFWYAEAEGLCTTEIWVLRARPDVASRFVRYIVETDPFIDVASGAYGTHMPRSDWGMVRALPVAIPPYAEQVAIGSSLCDIDTEIGLLQRRLQKAENVKQGMMQQLLTGRTRLPVEVAS
ncbi:MAG: restriction endonuclease subunit S [Acidobacteriota bacterium]|nr:restriction endonuclease subunit S [Acidobacteriota bacterium]